jgi:hypothetical protein
MARSVMTYGRTKNPLKDRHTVILRKLMEAGPLKHFWFEEEDLDELFRMRPRLIKLVPGHTEAVVEITPEGVTALNARKTK